MAAGLFKIGNCLSSAAYMSRCAPARKWGVFKYPAVAERLIICTRKAWNVLNDPKNDGFLKGLEKDILSGNVETQRLAELGLCPRFYSTKDENWITFGLRMKEPNDVEYREYFEAEKLVHSTVKGAGRRAFFGIQGIRAEGVDKLEEDSYRYLLMRLSNEYKGRFRGEIKSISVEEIPFNVVSKEKDGTFTQSISRSLLSSMARHPDHFGTEPVLAEVPIDALKPPKGD